MGTSRNIFIKKEKIVKIMTSTTLSSSGKLFPTILCIIGAILSAYAVYVEYRTHKQKKSDIEEEFVALCDIESIGASCSRTFSLPQGKLLSYFNIVPSDHVLDVPNALLGLLHYLVLMSLENTSIFYYSNVMSLGLAMIAFLTSVYLAYALTMLKELCILCWTTHVINAILLIYYIQRCLHLSGLEKMKQV